MSRPGPAILARLTAEQLQNVADAADFGNCLECGGPVHWQLAIDGEGLCPPCGRAADEHDEAMSELSAAILPRVVAELDQPAGFWSLDGSGRWTVQPGEPGQLALAL